MKKTLVIGASLNPQRYSNLAILRLRHYNHPVLAIGLRQGTIGDVIIETGHPLFNDVDTVTLYINPERQTEYYEYIISLKPLRVIFNPGTENPGLEKKLTDAGIESVEACTLVLLSIKQY